MTNEAFNRDLKFSYSWLPKGKTGKIINKNTTGRCTLIASIFSDGNFLCMIVEDTVKTKEFIKFLQILRHALKATMLTTSENIWITLDNAPVHTSHESLNAIKSLDANTYFLHPHSPDLASVELFFRLMKKKILKEYWNKSINLNKPIGRKIIYQILSNLHPKMILNIWREFVKSSKRSIIKFIEKDNEN